MKTLFKQTVLAAAVIAASITSAQAVQSDNAGGQFHNLYVNAKGDVFAVGNNRYGQVAQSQTKIPLTMPNGVVFAYNDAIYKNLVHTGLVNVVSVAANGNRSVALKKDGTVYFWGAITSNSVNLTADKYAFTNVPVKVDITGVIDIAVSGTKLLMLKEGTVKGQGTVYEWNFDKTIAPSVVVGLPTGDITSIAASGRWSRPGETTTGNPVSLDHYRALGFDNSVYVWGDNDKGQLGVNDYVARATPVKLPILGRYINVSPSQGYVVTLNGDVYQSGWYTSQGTAKVGVKVPTKVPNAFGIVEVTGNASGSFALADNGSVYAWNWHNYIGVGGYLQSTKAVYIGELGTTGVGLGGSYDTFSVTTKDGKINAIGGSNNYQLGQGTNIEKHNFPNVIAVPVGTLYSGDVIATSDTSKWTWVDPDLQVIKNCLDAGGTATTCDPSYIPPAPKPVIKTGNNGWGNGDQDAVGNSGDHNNAENNNSDKQDPTTKSDDKKSEVKVTELKNKDK